jgi:hypothetical protein
MDRRMRAITIVLPHFQNLGMVAEQQRIWASYPSDLRSHLHVVIVDDCSPKDDQPSATSLVAEGLGSLRLYRLLEKKRWNWLACRNLGANVATTDWLLLTDMDHALPSATLDRLVTGDLDPRNAYRFRRVTATKVWPYDVETACTEYKPHNDSWALTRQLFFSDQVYGYDERLSGCYGTSGEFKDRVLSAARAHVLLPEVLIRYPRDVIPDASTLPIVYTRKDDPKNDAELRKRKAAREQLGEWRPLHGLVPWEQVA